MLQHYFKVGYIPTKEDRQKAYDKGMLMIEQKMDVIAFKLGNWHYSSNKNRKDKYSFKTATWNAYHIGIIAKIKLVMSGQYKRIA
jgi:hypothetical protein